MTPGQHIHQLCHELRITRAIAPGRGRANVKSRWIQGPPLRTEMAYFVNLHEIGHIVVGLEGTRLEREAAAWRWALEHALIRPHYSTRQRICALLVRYLYRAHRRGWVLPTPQSDYWRLLRWW